MIPASITWDTIAARMPQHRDPVGSQLEADVLAIARAKWEVMV